MVLKELILTLASLGRCQSCERTDFYQFLIWEGVKVVKELIFTSFLIWKGVLVLWNELIFNSFYIGNVCWS